MLTTQKDYEAPTLVDFGTVAELTAAIGSSSDEDQSDYPQEFPPNGGSYDVCNNENPTSVC